MVELWVNLDLLWCCWLKVLPNTSIHDILQRIEYCKVRNLADTKIELFLVALIAGHTSCSVISRYLIIRTASHVSRGCRHKLPPNRAL